MIGSALPPVGVVLTSVCTDAGYLKSLAGLNDPDSGVVCIRARPATRRFGWVARSILTALGKSQAVSGKGRNDNEDETLAAVWLSTRGITDLVVLGAEALDSDLLQDLTTLAYTVGLRLWLVAEDQSSTGFALLVDRWPAVALSQANFDAYWESEIAGRPQKSPLQSSSSGGQVPSADFTVFYSELLRLSDPDLAQTLTRLYREEFTAAVGFFEGAPDGLTEDAVASYLRGRLRSCSTQALMVTTTRACQAAAFNHYWFVQIDLPRLVASGTDRLGAVIADPGTWRALNAYRQPHRPAVCALVAAGLDLATIRDLPADAISDDFTEVTGETGTYTIPPGAEVYLRAQKLWGALSSQSELFISTEDSTPHRLRTFSAALDAAARELGLIFSPGAITRNTDSARQWRSRHGVSIQALDRPAGSGSIGKKRARP